MKSHKDTLILMAATIIVAASAFAQTTPNNPATVQKQHTDGDGITTVGPASGAYKQFSDPKGWDADAKAWHKQHTSWASAQKRPAPSYAHPTPVTAIGTATKQQ
jgi:hypothetical protein